MKRLAIRLTNRVLYSYFIYITISWESDTLNGVGIDLRNIKSINNLMMLAIYLLA